MPKKVFDVATLRSSVVIGNPSTYQEKQWSSATKQQFPNPGKPTYKRVKKEPNKSDVPFGDNRTRNFYDFYSEQFCKDTSSQSQLYEKRKPAPGFDRLSANKTNYELGETETVYKTQNMRSTQNPKNLPKPQGPTYPPLDKREFNPHNLAGYKYNLVTCKKEGYIQRPQPGSLPNCDKDLYGNLVGYGNPKTYYDLTVGRTRPKPRKPASVAEQEKNMEAPLDSLMALRPPLSRDKAYHPLGNTRNRSSNPNSPIAKRMMGASSIQF